MFEIISQQVIERAQSCARQQGYAVCISIVDAAGLLSGFLRMDDAVPGAIDVSIKKARTAALFRTDSIQIGAAAQPGGPIYSLEATNGGLISFGGGVVLHDGEGKTIGAVGVAGATVDADQAIALTAAGRP
ncbi:GlcG/HbpS family heme-binding protein [Achromobacter deleyi]|uniref:GlcG/HbpS family heme-binding protein n=1 Tax=Achromobacter deleyi TaxID=1353891 RepID=UPI0014919CA5|nr:heme-binding protein [Achromobacter deleyi]QVQ28445.1 heme-binding protein [Achromobacter deleyi]UIP18549.1 heme-binding protein [Achromobacter deleyi]